MENILTCLCGSKLFFISGEIYICSGCEKEYRAEDNGDEIEYTYERESHDRWDYAFYNKDLGKYVYA